MVDEAGDTVHLETREAVAVGRSEKMSKSLKNVVDPDAIIGRFGADTARWFMLSDSPPERDLEWTDAGAAGAARFVQRLWRILDDGAARLPAPNSREPEGLNDGAAATLRAATHRAIAAVTRDVEGFRFNVAVARLHEFANVLAGAIARSERDSRFDWALREGLESIVLLIGPMMPHFAEEAWEHLGHKSLVATTPWPDASPDVVRVESVTVGIQVNGKLRGTMEVVVGLSAEETREAALLAAQKQERIRNAIGGRSIRKIVAVPGRIVSIVI